MRYWQLLILSVSCSLLITSVAVADQLKADFEFKKRPPKAAVVYFSEDQSAKEAQIVDQKDKQFTQQVFITPKGSEVSFKNSDSLQHNIFANDPKAKVTFDTGLAETGSTLKQKVTWDNETPIKISCKIHPKMKAWLMSLSSKFYETIEFAKKQKTGSLNIQDVPGTLSVVKVWIPKYDPVEVTIAKGETKKVDVTRKGKPAGTITLTRS